MQNPRPLKLNHCPPAKKKRSIDLFELINAIFGQ